MNLIVDELVHLTLSLFVGFVIWRKWRTTIYVFVATLIGGFFIDLDHLFGYFLAFGTNFNLIYFLKGYQFLKTDKNYVIFHSWELVIILLVISFVLFFSFRKKTVSLLLLAFSLSLCAHLIFDVVSNKMLPQSYFLLYRIKNNFDLKTMMPSEQYQLHIKQKNIVKF